MADNNSQVSRRNVLKGTGGAFAAAAGSSGLAAAAPDDVVEVNIGFDRTGGGPGGVRTSAGAEAAAEARGRADEVVREFDTLDIMTLRLPKRAATALEQRAGVRYVEENGTMQAFAQTQPWGVDRVDADVAAAAGNTGGGADVAIIDTGIDDDHVSGDHLLGSGHAEVSCGSGGFFGCFFSGNSNACNETWSDDNDHGTHCAGIAAAANNTEGVVGVGPDITLHAVKVLDCAGSGTFSDIAAGINHVANQEWDVGSMSLGASSGSSTVDRAITNATNAGVTLVAAAGNSGPCTNCVGYPARHPDVVAVSASNCSDGLANFSSQGPEVDIIAPGASVLSTVPSGTATFSGTSMACPHVAGAAGVLAAQGQSRSQIISTLTGSAEDLGLGSNLQGAGLLDVAAAVGEDSSDDGFGNSGNC